MKQNLISIAILMFFLSIAAYSRPVHKRTCLLSQPDGSTFHAVFHGDEFVRIKTTQDGCAVIQEPDGWWCYAQYEPSGRKVSTGIRVGEQAPPHISRDIPYFTLSELASSRKSAVEHDEEPLLRRISRSRTVMTKAEGDVPEPVIKHGIVILAQFADLAFKHTAEDFRNLLNQDGYSHQGASGCAREYFDSQFNGSINFSFDVCEIVTLSKGLAAYGANITDDNGMENDKAPEEMIIEACQLADKDVDFSLYDDDGDGEVDNVFVFFAGGDEAEGAGDDCIWSHAWYIRDGAGKMLNLDGKMINRYACTSEMTRYLTVTEEIGQKLAGIGTFCHEYAHTFGLVDMYDTDYDMSGGEADGLWGSISLMDYGNENNGGNTPPFFNAIEREMLGMSEPELIVGDGVYSLEPIHRSGRYYRMNTDVEGEYFLFECRAEEGWDTYIGGKGLLVYHIDRSDNEAGYSDVYDMDLSASRRWKLNEVNCRPDHQCADLIEAVPESSGVANVFYPAMNVTEIPAERLSYWSEAVGLLSVTNISATDSGVSFNIIGNSVDTTPPVPVNMECVKFQDAAVITFESSRPYDGVASVSWGVSGREEKKVQLMPYEAGRYALVLEDLNPRTSYTVNVSFVLEGVSGKLGVVSFLTNSFNGGYPYIYLKNVKRNPDGSFPVGSRLPLRVYNAVGAAEVVWSLNGVRISVDETGYYEIRKGGTLRAAVSWEDGSTDVIYKEIILSE